MISPRLNNKGFNLNISSGGTGIVFNLGTGFYAGGGQRQPYICDRDDLSRSRDLRWAHLTLYLNGAQIGTTAFTGTIGTPTYNTCIAYDPGNSNYFPGHDRRGSHLSERGAFGDARWRITPRARQAHRYSR